MSIKDLEDEMKELKFRLKAMENFLYQHIHDFGFHNGRLGESSTTGKTSLPIIQIEKD